MSVRVLHSRDEGMAALYDSVTCFAFGPVFFDSDVLGMDAVEAAESFLAWLKPRDAREVNALRLVEEHGAWLDNWHKHNRQTQ